MEIVCITVSVNYSDILEHMIEQNSKFFKKWYIVTSPEDTNTIQLLEHVAKQNIQLLLFDDFYKTGCTFNKGGAVRFAQEYIDANHKDSNILILDSDISLPDDCMDCLPKSVNVNTLYGVSERKDYWTLDDFLKNEHPHIYFGGALCVGFFQLYNQNSKRYYVTSENCGLVDNYFRDSFPDRCLLGMSVKHLGKGSVNWNGRVTEVYTRTSI